MVTVGYAEIPPDCDDPTDLIEDATAKAECKVNRFCYDEGYNVVQAVPTITAVANGFVYTITAVVDDGVADDEQAETSSRLQRPGSPA